MIGRPIVTTECPKCACRDGETLTRFTHGGEPYAKRRCRHCRYVWSIPRDLVPAEPPVVIPLPVIPITYPVIRCPQCGSQKTRVSSTRRPIRHHKCDDCGHCFKSQEPE